MQRHPFDRIGFARSSSTRKPAPWRRRRLHTLERLEVRSLLSADGWHNTDNYLDVNADHQVSPLDALVVINDLNSNGARSLDRPGDVMAMSALDGAIPPDAFVDVNGDRQVSPADALMVVNAMNGLDQTDRIQVTLHATDLAGNEITQINTNTDFFLEAQVEGLNWVDSKHGGVFTAYIDVHYTAANLSIANDPFSAVFDGPYTNLSQFRDFGTDGEINDLGAFLDGFTLGQGPHRLWRVFMHADTAGAVTFTADGPEGQGRDFEVLGDNVVVPVADVDFVGTNLTIVEPPLVPATVTIGDVTKAEGNSGTTNFQFTVTISNNQADAIVGFNTTDGTAVSTGGASRDFNALTDDPLDNSLNPRLTFAAGGALTQTVTVQVVGNTTIEPDEQFLLNLVRPHNATLSIAQATGTITNDDGPAVSIADAQLVEGNAGTTEMVFNVTLDVAPTSPLTVVVTTSDDTATTTNGDFVAKTETITFGAGDLQKQVAVTINGDTTLEPDETFSVDLSNVSGGRIGDGHAVGTIANDDGAATFSIGNVTLDEGNGGGSTNFVFTVTLSTALATQATVAFATADGTATTADSDYAAQAGTLTFAPGETSKQITVPVTADVRNENDETFTVTLSAPTGATLSASSQGTGTITNDDAVPSLSIADAAATEGDLGSSPLDFTVTLSAASGQQVTVVFNTANGSATSPDDYTASSGTLTFAPGETTHTIVVPIVGDTLSEGIETFTVNLLTAANATISDDQATGTIDDNDPIPTLSINDVAQNEGNSGTTNFAFTVTLSAASAQTVTVAFLATDGSAVAPGDYDATNGTLTFAPGETTKTINVPVVGDTTTEPDESFTVILASPSGATIADGSGLGTIINDDGIPSIDITDVTQAEGDAATTDFSFTVSLSFLAEQEVTVVYATADGTANAGTDYAAQTGTLTFIAGESTKTITVAVNGDVLNEADETFFVNLSNPHNAFFAAGGNQGQGTIDNDDPAPSLSINDALVTEGAAPNTVDAVFTVTLSAASGQPVTVAFATANSSATAGTDYVAQAGTLTFAPGETSQTISVVVNGDASNEIDESVFVNLSDASNAEIADAEGVGTIANDDPQPSLSIAAPQLTTSEGNSGTTNMAFTVSLSAASGKEIAVVFATANVTAFAPGDYTESTGTLTFAAGEVSKTISVPIVGDTLDEPNETFTVTLTDPTNADLGTAVAIGTITDDDAQPTISIGDKTVAEGNAGNVNLDFNVTLSAASGQTITVVATTADGTAGQPGDYASKTETLTFAPGEITKTFTVSVAGDLIDEGDSETFRVNLSAPTNATILDAEATGTITDDDSQPSITINDVPQNEGNSGTTNFVFTVTLSNPSSSQVTVAFATANGTAIEPSDYTATSGALTFAPGDITKTITVAVKGDTFQEPDQTFNVNLTNATNSTIGDPQGVGTIVNDGDTGFEPVTVSGLVFVDTDNDGNRDTNIGGVTGNDEKGLSGAIVKLAGTSESGDAVDRQATTGADGAFTFTEVAPGTYTLTETQPAAYLDGIDTPGTGGTTTTNDVINVTVAGGAANTGHRFGERGLRPEFISKRLFMASANLNATISALSTQEGPAFLAFDAGWDGTLTARAAGSSAGAQPTLTLLDNNLHVLASSTRVNGESRLDYNGNLGQPYFIKVSGSNPDIDVALTNAVIQDGQTVTVRGTEGDDSFEFTAGTKNSITINGTSYSFTPAEVNNFVFEGRGGHDSVKFNGSAGADNATLGLGSGSMSGAGYRVSAADMASIVVDGRGGNDTATLLDSAGNDHLSGAANWLSLSSDEGLVTSLLNFENVRAKSTNGGHDTKLVGAIDFALQQDGTWFDE